MKKCICCNNLLDLSDFYTHPKMDDGHLNKCKNCCKSQAKERHQQKSMNLSWKEKEKERSRKKYHQLNYKEKYPYKKMIITNNMKNDIQKRKKPLQQLLIWQEKTDIIYITGRIEKNTTLM